MPDDSSTLPARYANGRFGPGNPGQPVGARNRNSRRAIQSVLEHFERNQERLLDILVNSDYLDSKALYLKFISRVLPRQIDVGPSDGVALGEEELAAALTRAQVLCDGSGDRRAALAELEAILLGAPRNEADHH